MSRGWWRWERRFERQAVRRYYHAAIRCRPCWEMGGWSGFLLRPCARCWMRWLTRDFERERLRIIERSRVVARTIPPIRYIRNADGTLVRDREEQA